MIIYIFLHMSNFLPFKKFYLLHILCLGILFGCSTQQKIKTGVGKEFKNSTAIKQYQVGFMLYDPEHKTILYQKDADKYFVPASNTKLFTFYAALKMLPDSIPALRYIEKSDSLIFWGTGDPSFLQSDLKSKTTYNFLASGNKKLFFAPGRYPGNFYGNGWSWDDYNDYYQAEINELPIMDNLIAVKGLTNGHFSITPKVFTNNFIPDSLSKSTSFYVKRNFLENVFSYGNAKPKPGSTQQIPYKTSIATTLNILADTLHKPVGLISMKLPAAAKTFYSIPRDSVLKQMMLPSDNFIAEQLLLVCSDQLGDTLSTEKTITHVLKKYLADLPDKPVWVDGSGLSKMNLFTPRDMVKILDLIYAETNNPAKLYNLLPAGGKSGTLRNAYPKTDHPFVFGKTGTLSGVHNQSGYVTTKKGKTYIFSFMNNNFAKPTAEVRKEMVRIMTYIHDHF